MKTASPLLAALTCALALPTAHAQLTVDFEDFDLPLDTFLRADAMTPDTTFSVEGVLLPSVYDTSFGGYWAAGWAISTSRDDSTGAFTNLYGAAPGEGAVESQTYAVGQQGSYLLVPPDLALTAVSVTNLTYTATVLDEGSEFSRPFSDTSGAGAGDSLILVLTGFLDGEERFTYRHALADFRDSTAGASYILRSWAEVRVDSQRVTAADSITFTLLSSDRGEFGNNTPNFFAVDNLVFSSTPVATREPILVEHVAVVPNPSTGYIRLATPAATGKLTVFDAAGRQVYVTADYTSGSEVDVSALAPGLYFAVWRSDELLVRTPFVRR